jgi:hypothetical protein
MTGKPEVIGLLVGLVPINARVLSGLANFRVVGKPELILGPDLFGGQAVTPFNVASNYRNLIHHRAATLKNLITGNSAFPEATHFQFQWRLLIGYTLSQRPVTWERIRLLHSA